MDSSLDGGLGFLHSWADDLDPATRRDRSPGAAVIDLAGVYLPEAGEAAPSDWVLLSEIG